MYGKPQLAIYIRAVEGGGLAAFYTMEGRGYIHTTGDLMFSVKRYIEPDEVKCLNQFVPSKDAFHEEKEFEVPVTVGVDIIKQMHRFWKQANTVYRSAASRLEDAHRHLAHQTDLTYHTLEEIAAVLLPRKGVGVDGEKYSQPELYAVHRAILGDELALRPVNRLALRNGGHYEISPRSVIEDLSKIKDSIRQYQEAEVKHTQNSEYRPKTLLHTFASRARRMVDRSRQSRQFTPFGTLGPRLSNDTSVTPADSSSTALEKEDEVFIRFLNSWTVQTAMSRKSYANGFGSVILRAVNRYEGVDLNACTGWTFLQELGIISPWETRAPHTIRMSSIGKLLAAPQFRADVLTDIRKDWADLPVYCVDEVGAHELDDGVSIETTGIPDEYWVHAHTADPASHIDPKSNTAEYARAMITTVYMPHQIFPMLPSEFVESNLSLKSNRPCLTFSAKVNLDGEILDTKISPGVIRNVKFLTPTAIQEVVTGQIPNKQSVVYSTGPDATPRHPRHMHDEHDLVETDRINLGILRKISLARERKCTTTGGIAAMNANISLSITLNAPTQASDITYDYHEDPSIKLRLPNFDPQGQEIKLFDTIVTIKYLMLLAGEVAARWCQRRGVPIPYRVTPRNPANQDPGEFFRQVILPILDDVPMDLALQYFQLIGGVVSSTTPGPHMSIGADIMTRSTSPLRRYGDLLVHWQIEAALLEEARTGKSLVGNTSEDFLPFTKEHLDAFLPHLDSRESLVRKADKAAKQEWLCHFLVRAWHFKEAKLPSPLRLEVRHVFTDVNRVTGVLAEIPTTVEVAVEPTELKEINVGDCFEVELEHVDVYRPRITVKPVKKIDVKGRLFNAFPMMLSP